MKTPAVILEGVTCKALYSVQRMFCHRGINLWWREIWLERVSTDAYSGVALPIAGRQIHNDRQRLRRALCGVADPRMGTTFASFSDNGLLFDMGS